MRRLLLLVCALFVLEASLYSTLAPLLPHYAHALRLSRTTAGILTGAYAAGLIPGAAISNRLAARMGARTTILSGLLLLGGASVDFGLGNDTVALIAARAVQGIACGCVWGGGLAWLTLEAPAAQRGRLIGTAFGAATFGTLIGPVLGTIALTIGTPAAFSLVALAALGLGVWVFTIPAPAHHADRAAPLLAPYRDRTMHLPISLNLVLALPSGLLAVLIPLRLTHLGASPATVAATFLVASAVGAVISPLAGRLSDQSGRLLPIRTGLVLAVPFLVILPLSASVALTAALTIVFLGAVSSLSFVPAVAWITDQGEHASIASAVPAAIMTGFALGETIGSAGGASLAQTTFDAAPYVLLALLHLGALALLRTPRDRAEAREHGLAQAHHLD